MHSFNEPIPPCNVPREVGSPLKVGICRLDHGLLRSHGAVWKNDRVTGRYPGVCLWRDEPPRPPALGLCREGDEVAKVPRPELLRRLSEADILFLLHGFTGSFSPEEYQTIFPTKTIEYLISGRPILAHTSPGCFLTRFCGRTSAFDRRHARSRRAPGGRGTVTRGLPVAMSPGGDALRTARQFQATEVAAELRRWLNA